MNNQPSDAYVRMLQRERDAGIDVLATDYIVEPPPERPARTVERPAPPSVEFGEGRLA